MPSVSESDGHPTCRTPLQRAASNGESQTGQVCMCPTYQPSHIQGILLTVVIVPPVWGATAHYDDKFEGRMPSPSTLSHSPPTWRLFPDLIDATERRR